MGRELFQVIRERQFGELSSAEKNLVNLMNDLKVLKPKYPTNPYDNSRYGCEMDVYETLLEAVQTMNSKTIKPRGVLYAQAINSKIVIGFALLNSKYFEWNKENKEVLREIARGRAMTWFPYSLNDVKIPESIMTDLYVFIKRANAYFKQETLVDWAREFITEEVEEKYDDYVENSNEFNITEFNEFNEMVNTTLKVLFGSNTNVKFVADDQGC
jgi:hypothetical protein